MTCNECGDKPKNTAKDFPKAVVEITNPETLVLLRKVVIPATIPEASDPPAIGKYRNVILQYEETSNIYIYSSDGIPTAIEAGIPQDILDRIETLESGEANLSSSVDSLSSSLSAETAAREAADTRIETAVNGVTDALAIETTNRTNADTSLQNQINAIVVPTKTSDLVNDGADGTSSYAEVDEVPVVDSSLSVSSSNTVQNAAVSNALNNSVMTGLSVGANSSTTTVQLDGAKKNLYSGATNTDNIPLPVASSTQAGVMNSATFMAVTANTNNINAILNGAVAITGLSASPSQADLTTVWQNETGLTALINRAGIYDVTNNKVWTYYTNDNTWHAASNIFQVTVSPFTNTSAGTIHGSTNVGQIFAENDGTGSVNGWDSLSSSVSANTGNISSLQTAVAGKQDTLTPGTGIDITDNVISATSSGPTVVQATGTSTTDVMSQASTSQMVFPSGFEISKDRIAVGDNAVVSAAKGVAIGQRATSSHAGSVAIGHGALTHVVGEVSINSTYNTSYGYNNTSYRLLTGLYDPQSAHDAANKQYVDNSIPATFTTNEWNALWA